MLLMNSADDESPGSLLQKAMHGQLYLGPPNARWEDVPWRSMYPPADLVDDLLTAIQKTGSKSAHYVGLCDQLIVRRLDAVPGFSMSFMDMIGIWSGRRDLPGEIASKTFYAEGAPRHVHLWIQDTLIGSGSHPILNPARRLDLRCIAAVGPAIDQVPLLDEFEWQLRPNYRIGVRGRL